MEAGELGTKRGNRRWFLGASGAAAGAVGLAAIGCGGGPATKPTSGPAPRETESPTSQVATTPTAQKGKRGDTLRYTGFVAGDASQDPHKTQAGPFYGQQALVFSRLLSYESMTTGKLAPDLALGMPEQPDAQTLIFRINPEARWHDRDPLNGRSVTARDVEFSLRRQMDGGPSFVRKAQWANIDSIEVSDADAHTFTIKLKAPQAAIVNAFADVNSFIVAPELVDKGRDFAADFQVGSGPFRWVEWSEGKFASVARNPKWHGGNDRPNLDGVTIFQPKDSAEVEAGLRTKKLDVAFVGRPQADKLKKAIPALQESTVGRSLFFGMRFFLPQFPYNDVRFRSAVSIALDRRDMLQQFFGGSGEVNPWVSWPISRWSLPQAELATMPGYRPGANGRAQDITEARALLAAFASSQKVPDELPLFVLNDAETNLRMGSIMRDQLQQSLGLNVKVYPVAIGELITRLLSGQAPWAAGPDNGWVDLDDWVYPYFHSSGTKNSFPVRDAALDKLIESQRSELNESQRRDIGFEIQRKLLGLNAGVNFVSERVVALGWSYVKDFPLDAADGYQQRMADCWIDQSDPTYRGRA
ncbi:MAG: ABC transporter substrate-binding protein [Anaerolineaceae bacterium]